jgi:transglutaminase-like putative cysteine protease
MSLIRISHRTEYTYTGKVGFGRHRLVIRPREGHDVRVEEMKIQIEPRHELFWTRDVFGNTVGLVDFLEDAARLSIASYVLLRQHHAIKRGKRTPQEVKFPVVYDTLESVVAAAYRATSYPDDSAEVRAFLTRHDLGAGTDAQKLLDQINAAVLGVIKYRARQERGVQGPGETLERKSGSCRDVATLMMECCRNLGMAARFASGYLDCAAARKGHASTHAWVEVYLPVAGWIGLDGTTGQRVGARHIACGLSNHPRGVMPVSGTYEPSRGTRYLGMTASVGIEPVAEAASDRAAAPHSYRHL